MTFIHSKLPDQNRLFLLTDAPIGAEGYAWQQSLQADRQGYLYIEDGAVVRKEADPAAKVTLKIRRVKEGVEVLASTVEGSRTLSQLIVKANYLPVMLVADPEPIPTLVDAIHADEAKRHQESLAKKKTANKRKPK